MEKKFSVKKYLDNEMSILEQGEFYDLLNVIDTQSFVIYPEDEDITTFIVLNPNLLEDDASFKKTKENEQLCSSSISRAVRLIPKKHKELFSKLVDMYGLPTIMQRGRKHMIYTYKKEQSSKIIERYIKIDVVTMNSGKKKLQVENGGINVFWKKPYEYETRQM